MSACTEIHPGEVLSIPFTINGTDGLPRDLTNDALQARIFERQTLAATITEAVTASGQVIVDPDQVANKGKGIATFSAAATSALNVGELHQWSVSLQDEATSEWRVVIGPKSLDVLFPAVP